MAIETALGKALPDTNEEVVKSANTPRDHGQGTFFFKLFRCQHSSAFPLSVHLSTYALLSCTTTMHGSL